MLAVVLLPEAADEFDASTGWYEAQSPGLGLEFRSRALATFEAIADNPRMFPRVVRDQRRAVIGRFPYSVFFSVEPDAIVVAAAFHSSRDPRALAERL